MATVALTPVAAAEGGVDPSTSYTSATAGNTYTVVNEGKPFVLQIHNATGGTLHATLAQPAIPGERQAGAGKSVAVAAGGTVLAGPYDPNLYGELVSVTVDGALSIAAVQLPETQRKSYA